jgi:uncharacterized Zn-binding protein involved in type VI secretion
VSDPHTCPKCAEGPIKPEGCKTVRVGNQPAAREGDEAECCGGIDKVTEGERSVLIGGKPAARVGDATAAGGSIVKGLASVWIGKERPKVDASEPVGSQ